MSDVGRSRYGGGYRVRCVHHWPYLSAVAAPDELRLLALLCSQLVKAMAAIRPDILQVSGISPRAFSSNVPCAAALRGLWIRAVAALCRWFVRG
jgi:hypothetical protein